jgi:hypothetical protein
VRTSLPKKSCNISLNDKMLSKYYRKVIVQVGAFIHRIKWDLSLYDRWRKLFSWENIKDLSVILFIIPDECNGLHFTLNNLQTFTANNDNLWKYEFAGWLSYVHAQTHSGEPNKPFHVTRLPCIPFPHISIWSTTRWRMWITFSQCNVKVYFVFVLSCAGSGLATAWFAFQGVLLTA